MPDDGIQGGGAGTNSNQPVYYYSQEDLLVAARPSNGGSAGEFSVNREWATVVEAGYGFRLYDGLVYELVGASSGNTVFDLSGATGSGGGVIGKCSGSARRGKWHAAAAAAVPPRCSSVTNAQFQRVEWRGVSKNNTGKLSVFVPPNTTVKSRSRKSCRQRPDERPSFPRPS